MSIQVGTVVAGDFRIVQAIAEGGMGQVFVALQLSTGKNRALKLMKRELLHDGTLLARFEQEAKIGARIASDHIVEVVGAGVDATLGTPWIAMELLQGETLAEMLARRGALPPRDARVLFAQIGHALAAAHRAGVVHRDLKPENIYIARVQQLGVDFKVKILDLGIAKLFEEVKASQTGTLSLGTPRYMAPEQTGGQPITPQTDVWAIGLVAFQVLTGRYYWKRAGGGPSESVLTLMREVLFEPLTSASRRAAELGVQSFLPQGFDAWFARCVAREPRERFRDAAEAHAALDPILVPGGSPMASVGSMSASPAAMFTGREPGHVSPVAASVPFANGSMQSASQFVGQPPGRPSGHVVGISNLSASTQSAGAFPRASSESAQRSIPGVDPGPRRSSSKPRAGIAVAIVAGTLTLGGIAVGAYYVTSNKAKKTLRTEDGDRRERGDDEVRTMPGDMATTYELTDGSYPNGETYSGFVTLTRQRGNRYEISWTTGTDGIALRSDKVLGAAWGNGLYGVAIYDVDHGTLTGRIVNNADTLTTEHVLRGPAGLQGTYVLEAPDDSPGTATIVPAGDTYAIKYTFPTQAFEGTGIVVDGKLVVGFGWVGAGGGVAVYTRRGKRFQGQWAARNGTTLGRETWRKK